jgi:trehalose 6-phosphate phosphatase
MLPVMTHTLADIVKRVASAPVLLVATDFDGTLAPLVEHHDLAAPNATAVAALARLSLFPHTHVAVVSGRGLADLHRRLGVPPQWQLSGSHGAEIDGEADRLISAESRSQLGELARLLIPIADRHPGCLVESKPRGVAFHYRGVSEEYAGSAVDAVTTLAGQFPALNMRFGSMVIEFVVDKVTKADGLRHLRHRTGASAVMFIGDDLTDEHAFQSLVPTDAAVKVGLGETTAPFRVGSVDDVARLLVLLADEREGWVRDRELIPITAHAVLSDQRTLALVTPTARVTWLCLPRIDSPPVFAELLGGPGSGFFEVAPADEIGAPQQEYDGHSLVLQTRWPSCTVTDYLDCGSGRAFQRAGRSDLIRVIDGTCTCRVRFAPRLDFGRVATRLAVREHGLEVEGSADPILLYSPGVRWQISEDGPHQTAEAEVNLSLGQIVLELRAGSANDRPYSHPESQRRQGTLRFWSTWAGTLRLPGVATGQVRRSAMMLRALVYGPSGAIAAAATTSLPEHLGGERNWDYRYCWPRDAAMAAAALVRLGNTGTAMRFLDWLARVLDQCESPGRLRPIYTVDGRDLGPEAEISGMAGYGGSRPVRVGNAAAQQVQLDVFGPITDLIALLAESGAPIFPDHWRMTRAMVDAVEARWHEPDHGIWEIRGERLHHVHSKVMCFHTVNRALVVHDCVIGRANPAWVALRDQIREEVLARGFNTAINAFTAAYDRPQLDAATLSVGLTGLVDIHDPRFAATVNAVEKHLRVGGTVYRYRFDDGLPGREGGFHLCTGWLIEALALSGRVAQARELLESLLRAIGPTGTLSEQLDPELNMPLGNAPQAYSHLAVINAALCLERLGVVSDLQTAPDIRGQIGERP